MRSQKRNLPTKIASATKRHQLAIPQNQPKIADFWQKLPAKGTSIRRKIGFGYAIAVGITVLGTASGLAIGDFYQHQAQQQLNHAIKQEQLLNELQRSVLHMRLNHHEFINLMSKPQLFAQKHAQFQTHIISINQTITELQSSAKITHLESLDNFLYTCAAIASQYSQEMETVLYQADPVKLTASERKLKQQQIAEFTTSAISLRFDAVLSDAVKFIQESQQRQHLADTSVQNARILRTEIVALSMLLSISIAAILAIYTSRAIARPLENVTQIAQQASEEVNFALQVPVVTQDEVGMVAIALNRLISRVSEYTQELEIAHETLEKRVAERTEELSENHQQLTAALQALQERQAQLIQNEKMSSLGQMVAGVAHEINNPINFIYGNLDYTNSYVQDLLDLLQLYQQYYPAPPPAIQEKMGSIDLEFLTEDFSQILLSMKSGTDRIRKIVLSLRNFSRLDESEIKTIDIHEGIESTLLLLNHRFPPEITVAKKYGNLTLVECYPSLLNQVFMNMINNAIDALQEDQKNGFFVDGKPTIIIQTSQIERDRIAISFWNNGSVIPSELLGKLFDPFFTTKPVGQGTGLGLTICYQIIERHKGKIEVFSAPDKGTEFVISLPITRG